MSINQKSGRQTFRRRFVSGSLFVSPCPPECYLQSETKIKLDLRLLVNKTSVSHFKVKNTPLKHTDAKGNLTGMLRFLQVDKGALFFIKLSFEEFKIHQIFITADRSTRPVLKRHQVAKFFNNFQVNFVPCSQENEVFVNILS